MGTDVDRISFDREDRRRYRERVRSCIDVLGRLLADDRFETDRSLMGVELEFHVVDGDGLPRRINEQLLDGLESQLYQTELAQFNIEFNLEPHRLTGDVFSQIREELDTSFAFVTRRARDLDAHVLMIGVLPTVRDLDVTVEALSANPRYRMLNDAVLDARGEDLVLDIPGPERLELRTSSITMEAAATSLQLHLQVDPDRFARTWNAAQAIAGAQLAMGANSPFFLGHELMSETRIALFEQVIDTRNEELAAQGVRPRVWFGERWIDGPLDLWDENATYFPALLPVMSDEDPQAAYEAGELPGLAELTLLNGTIWRWNRPVYGTARGKPHLRVENRVLPAGPTVVDVVANAALWYGLVQALVDADEPVEAAMPFEAASDGFRAAARRGIEAELFWPGVGAVPARELVLRHLLPLADEGLRTLGIDADDRDRLLSVVEGRCTSGINGAVWQRDAYHALLRRSGDRAAATLGMVRAYRDGMLAGTPVHTWHLP